VAAYDPARKVRCATRDCAGVLEDLAQALTVRSDSPEDLRQAACDPRNVFGKYVLLRELGRGGMGAVYKAWDTTLKRWVALKFLLLPGDAEDLRRFRREAETAAALKHPHLAAIYEVGEVDGRPFIAMEYVDGQTLHGMKLPVRRACEVLRQVALAVDAAHAQSIVHRDLKPGNILLDAKGKPTVLDFGLAKSLKDAQRLTLSGTALGTPCYMSPEQAEGRRDVDARSDVYQLGAVLYELVTGRPPFRGETPQETLRRVVDEDVIPPSRVASVPGDVETIVLRAMEKERGRRYPTARAFADDLGRYLEGRAIQARPVSTLARLRRAMRRHAAAVVAAAAILLLAAAGLAYLSQRARRAGQLDEHLREAAAAFQKGRTEEALQRYSSALEIDPDRADVRRRLDECRARIREASERARRTAAEKERADASRPAYEEGRAQLEEAFRDLYRQGADLVGMRTRLTSAIDAFSRSIEAWPQNADAFYERGRARALRFDAEEADRDLARAVELRPGFAQARAERGRRLLERYVEARIHRGWEWDERAAAPYAPWLAAAKKETADPAFVAFAEGRLEECLRVCDARLREKREQEEVWKLKGDALWFGAGSMPDGNPSETQALMLRQAAEAYTEALRLRPNYYEARMMRGYIRKAQGNLPQALEDVSVGHALRPDDALACWFMGQAAGSPAQALEWYERGLRHRPDSFICRMNRAAALGQLGRLEESAEELERSMGLNPSHHYPFYLRGALRSRRGQMEEAYQDFLAVTARAPGFHSGWYNLGAAAYNTGRYREAIQAMERALSAGHPEREKIESALRAARQKLGH
jgi:serine/threonine-protein kinase